MRILGDKESLKGTVGILQIPLPLHPNYTDEKEEAQGEEVGVSGPTRGSQQLDQLYSQPATSFWILRRE